jgi:hypothetical protein
VIITGLVVDVNDAVIGDLCGIEIEALEAWEQVLTEHGIL